MRTAITGIPDRDPMCLFHNVRMWLALANGGEWTDATTPRTDRPSLFQFRQWREDGEGRVIRRAESRIIRA